MKKIAVALSTLLISAASFAQTWSVDKAHSRLGFGITHMTISQFEGNFKSFEASITSSKEDFSDAVFEISADVNTINTDIEKRDEHVKSADVLDAAKYPKLTFKSTSFKKVSGKQYKLVGDLTFHGVTKPVTLDVVYNGNVTNPMSKKTVAGFRFTGSFKRSDFGIAPGFPEAMLSDEVQLLANGEFTKN
ncbi:Polyisoprenoid-binding protein YceI [Filimonas lacunae]|uniref:Polyisoprenoid-binding protein YceI n=1 Tax=Filimonas lacunae TaxID=477680 RepID=A0A173MC22_9BACT|nr:YceI family protein [Filimonas lacunae]BAV05134.1 YceI like family protein [Filimonas lacunae]SIT34176.1 Polyisoprenoid-binding protein YceI [Filimonas lacunae]